MVLWADLHRLAKESLQIVGEEMKFQKCLIACLVVSLNGLSQIVPLAVEQVPELPDYFHY